MRYTEDHEWLKVDDGLVVVLLGHRLAQRVGEAERHRPAPQRVGDDVRRAIGAEAQATGQGFLAHLAILGALALVALQYCKYRDGPSE